MGDDTLFALVMLCAMFCAVGLVLYVARGRQRLRELAMRERIALIEKGLVPPPEMDPGRFEAQTRLIVAARAARAQRPGGSTAARYRSAGVIMMGLGCALLVLLTFAGGVPDVGFGVGGGFAILGLAVFVNGLIGHEPAPAETTPIHAPHPSEPPDVGP